MKLKNRIFLLPVLLFILPSVHCYRKYDLEHISQILKSGINFISDPCIDFYKYACGNWIYKNEKPENVPYWDINKMSEATGYTMIRDMLEKREINQNNIKALIEKKFYDACKDYSRTSGRNLFKSMLSATKSSNWSNVMQFYANKAGELQLFGIKLNEKNYLQIGAPVNATVIKQDNKERIPNIRKLFELYDRTSLRQNLTQLRTFLSDFHQLVVTTEPNFKKMTILKFQKYYDKHCPSLNTKINWLDTFQHLAAGSKMNFTDSDHIYVDKEYIKGFCNLLQNTSESAIVNYLHYNFIMADEMYTYVDVPFDSKSDGIRSIFCVEHLPISDGIYSEFLQSFITREINDMVRAMFHHLRTVLIEEIENSWLMGPVKRQALEIARELKFRYVMRPNRHAKSLQHVSYDFEVHRIGLQTLISFKKAQMIRKMNIYLAAKIIRRKQSSRTRQKRYLETDTCYREDDSELYIEASYLLPPFFHINATVGFNYGRLAFVIAHEMSHAFDYGKMKKRLNCSISTYKRELESILEEKKDCFVKEFDQFDINGTATISENICDKQGIKLAFVAMKRLILADVKLKTDRLPKFELMNQEKLFFLSYANQWCPNPEVNKFGKSSVHSPNKFRIQGALRNSYEFARTFTCDDHDYMNPKSKCDLWSKPNYSPVDDSSEASEVE